MSESSADILARLHRLHPTEIDLSLDRLTRLLGALGNPERALPPVIHIAGTNGKGSTGAFLRAGLEAAGQRVHAYTSPHLVSFHERIRLAGAVIEEAALCAVLRDVEAANDGDAITFFEVTTAAALLAFARTPADYTILEVGLGGRLDATNVVATPALSLITPVSHDHMEFLGETLAEIAAEKAGIIKPGVPVLVAPQELDAMQVVRAVAAALDAPMRAAGTDWTVREEGERLAIEHPEGLIDLPKPALHGAHQAQNAALAVMALRALGIDEGETLSRALTRADWPARMQRLRAGPLVDAAPPGAEIWLDGGHNPSAGAALAAAFADLEEREAKPLFLVCGMLATKDPHAFLAPFEGLATELLAVTIPDEPGAMSAEDIAVAGCEVGILSWEAESLDAAMTRIAEDAETPPRILVCGSLYLAGVVLRGNG